MSSAAVKLNPVARKEFGPPMKTIRFIRVYLRSSAASNVLGSIRYESALRRTL
jgi:hypothetical protein